VFPDVRRGDESLLSAIAAAADGAWLGGGSSGLAALRSIVVCTISPVGFCVEMVTIDLQRKKARHVSDQNLSVAHFRIPCESRAAHEQDIARTGARILTP